MPEVGGAAVVGTLLGVHAPVAGRLPVTFYSRDILSERDPSCCAGARASHTCTTAAPAVGVRLRRELQHLGVRLGLGRIVALHYCSSVLYQIY